MSRSFHLFLWLLPSPPVFTPLLYSILQEKLTANKDVCEEEMARGELKNSLLVEINLEKTSMSFAL